jgi:hypothetical protein
MKEHGSPPAAPAERAGKGSQVLRGTALILLLLLLAGSTWFLYTLEPGPCAVCQRPLHGDSTYRIVLAGGENLDVCCPRCGLHYQELNGHQVQEAWIGDVSSEEFLPAEQAVYVENPSVSQCCSMEHPREDGSGRPYTLAWDRCLPGLVAFKDRRSALEFQRSQGGTIKSYQELLAEGRH